MIIRDVLGEESSEMALVQRDDVIEQIATTAADPGPRHRFARATNGGL